MHVLVTYILPIHFCSFRWVRISSTNYKIVFLFLQENICCVYSFESSRWGISNEYTQHVFMEKRKYQGPVVQSIVSLTSSLRVISLTVLGDSIYNILIFFAEKIWVALHCKSYSHFFSKNLQHICVSLDVNFNESLTNVIVSFEQLGPVLFHYKCILSGAMTLSQI